MCPRQSTGPERPSAPPSVRRIDHEWIELPDGVRLAARLWLPGHEAGAPERAHPAILEAVPYRKSDGTAVGDAAWGSYFAARGFAYVRLDLRGSGDSEGVIDDEYSEQEQRDVEQVIGWIAGRAWCTGAVGMIGISWGGFAALQLAARAPAQLCGVVPIHASDDRYADDVHYVGGCVSAIDMSQWATSMLAYLSQPPDPLAVGERWRAMWEERLEGTPPFIERWLAHQRRDDYWRQGSACERYEAIECPVFAVGGWSDGYRDMVLRVVEHVRAPVRGLIGPWGHTGPEEGAPGPAIGFLQECVRFFEASLAGADNGFFDEPSLITYMQEAVAPAGGYARRAGRWVADPSWPSPSVSAWEHRLVGASLVDVGAADGAPLGEPRRLRGLESTGLDGGVWCGDGGPADFPLDQRRDDAGSLCWEGAPLSERVELLGCGEAVLEVSVDRPQALLAVRVCDVAPDGASTLVARGLLNLSRREGHDRSVPMPVETPVVVRVALQSTAYALPAGHRLRLAVSTNYWPWAWPAPEPVTLTVHPSAANLLSLPRRQPEAPDAPPVAFGEPETGERLASETTRLEAPSRRVTRDLSTGATELEFRWQAHGERILATDTELTEENVTTYRIVDGDPLSASVRCRVTVTLQRPGWRIRCEVASTMSADRSEFVVTTTNDVFEGETRIHARTYTHRFPRDGA